MANTTKIDVQAVDNELILLASTGRCSELLCHLKSGFNAPVSYVFNPGHILPPGSYELTAIGINWGRPLEFQDRHDPAHAGVLRLRLRRSWRGLCSHGADDCLVPPI